MTVTNIYNKKPLFWVRGEKYNAHLPEEIFW